MTPTLTVREKLLLAACSMDGPSFEVTALVVRAWELYPESFALRGYPQHPDSNRVLAKLAGSTGLVGVGKLKRLEVGNYSVTRKGRALAEEFMFGRRTESPAKAALSSRSESEANTKQSAPRGGMVFDLSPPAVTTLCAADVVAINALARTPVLAWMVRGRALDLDHVCSFYGITQPYDICDAGRVADVGALIERVIKRMGKSGATDPRLPSVTACFALRGAHGILRKKFADEFRVACDEQHVPHSLVGVRA